MKRTMFQVLIFVVCGISLASYTPDEPQNPLPNDRLVPNTTANDGYNLAFAEAAYRTGTEIEKAAMRKKVAEEIAMRKSFTFSNIAVVTPKPTAQKMMETGFDISATYTPQQAYSPFVVEINAYFSVPGRQGLVKAPAFYKKDTTPRWAVRFNPPVQGEYHYYLKDEKTGRTSNVMSFNVAATATGNKGKLSVKGVKFHDASGNEIALRGFNMAAGYTVSEYETAAPVFKNDGINFIRFWTTDHERWFRLEGGENNNDDGWANNRMWYDKIGIYRQSNAARIDRVLQTFESNGIYVLFCLFNIWEFQDNHWKSNPYNVANGGMANWTRINYGATCDTNWWTHALAVKYQAQLVRYVAARYAAYSSFAIMQYWNECDNSVLPEKVNGQNVSTEEMHQIVARWHEKIGQEFDKNNAYNTPHTTSFAWIDDFDQRKGTNMTGNAWNRFPTMKATNPHRYDGNHTGTTSNYIRRWISAIQATKNSIESNPRPTYLGEYGPDTEEFTSDYLYLVYEGIWTPLFFANAAASNLFWFNGYEMWRPASVSQNSATFRSYFKINSDFLTPFESRLSSMTQSYKDEGGLHWGTLKNADTALMYITDGMPGNNGGRQHNGKSITITGMTNGSYRIKYLNPVTGQEIKGTSSITVSGGTLVINLPDFTRNIAVSAVKM